MEAACHLTMIVFFVSGMLYKAVDPARTFKNRLAIRIILDSGMTTIVFVMFYLMWASGFLDDVLAVIAG